MKFDRLTLQRVPPLLPVQPQPGLLLRPSPLASLPQVPPERLPRLPPGLLLAGKQGLDTELERFDNARAVDLMNEKRPDQGH